jgi:peroxiredoxin Q/BCP
MAQLRQDYDQFLAHDTEVLVIGPDNADKFASYFTKNDLPFPGLPDPKHSVLKRYGQEVKIFKLGRMPAQALVDKQGVVRFIHYGNSMSDIPDTAEMLEELETLKGETAGSSA